MNDTRVAPRRRRRAGGWAALISVFILATAALVGTASSAFADPTGCTTVNGGNFAESRCAGGDGEHRVVMRQRHFNPEVGEIACVGPWVPVGSVSRTQCASQQVISVTVETQGGTTTPPRMEPRPPTGPVTPPSPTQGFDCRTDRNGAQLVANPGGYNALNYTLTIEYCYNSQRDLVKLTPVAFSTVDLSESERMAGLPRGTVGTILITDAKREGPTVSLSQLPLRTRGGESYTNKYTINFTFTPNGGQAQTYRASASVTIDFNGAMTPPSVLERLS